MSKTNKKLIVFPQELIKNVEKYQKENYIRSFTQAVIQLVLKGLEK